MNSTKVFIIILVVIAVLFVAATGVGVLRKDDNSQAATQPAWADIGKSLLPADTPIKPADLRDISGGLAPLTDPLILVAPGQQRKFRIGKSETKVRTLRLEVVAPGDKRQGNLRWEPITGAAISIPLYAGKTVTLKVLEDGGVLIVSGEVGTGTPPLMRAVLHEK